jgi:hypothetical protein
MGEATIEAFGIGSSRESNRTASMFEPMRMNEIEIEETKLISFSINRDASYAAAEKSEWRMAYRIFSKRSHF